MDTQNSFVAIKISTCLATMMQKVQTPNRAKLKTRKICKMVSGMPYKNGYGRPPKKYGHQKLFFFNFNSLFGIRNAANYRPLTGLSLRLNYKG